MKKLTTFGITTVKVNGREISTFRIRVSNTQFNVDALQPICLLDNNIWLHPVEFYIKFKLMRFLEISYVGMYDSNKWEMFKKLGQGLKAIQLNNLSLNLKLGKSMIEKKTIEINEKYMWSNEQTAVEVFAL